MYSSNIKAVKEHVATLFNDVSSILLIFISHVRLATIRINPVSSDIALGLVLHPVTPEYILPPLLSKSFV